MKTAFPLIAVIALLGVVAASSSFAEPPTSLGDVSITGLFANVRGNEAKFNEYRDLRDGAYGQGHFLYDTDAWFLTGDMRDAGYDTQRYRLEGGLWGAFRADAFYQELPHNMTFGARSMFRDVGSSHLLLPSNVNPNDYSTWPSTFDYSTKRRQAGGSLTVDLLKPFFFTLSGQTEERRGIKPAGVSLEMNDLFALELPEPVAYRTDTVKAEAGYAQKGLLLDVWATYSRFHNSHDTLGFPNVFDQTTGAIIVPGAATTPDLLTLPPSNNYYAVGAKGAVPLPFHSKVNVSAGWSQTTSSVRLLSDDVLDAVAPAPSLPFTLSRAVFNGMVETENANIVLTSNPVDFLDGKVFYKFYTRDNKSDRITQADAMGDVMVNRLFGYQKKEAGAEVGFWLPDRLHLTTGYTRVITDRRHRDTQAHNAITADTDDDVYSAELTWKGLEFMTARTGYEHLVRHWEDHPPSPVTTEGLPIGRTFDLAPQIRDRIKVSIDLDPTEFLSVGVGYRHTETDYEQPDNFGLRHDRREQVFTNADLRIGRYAQLFGAFDYEWVTRRQRQQDQSVSPKAVWRVDEQETYYDLSVGAEIILLPKKLLLRPQYSYAKSEGNVDLTLTPDALNNPASVLAGTGADNRNIDIPHWDNYTKESVGAELIYGVTKQISVAIGYAYERFKYSDAQWDGYQLVTPTTGADHNGAFFTGAYARPSYDANLVFARLTYRFE